jgi:hypothetical protein
MPALPAGRARRREWTDRLTRRRPPRQAPAGARADDDQVVVGAPRRVGHPPHLGQLLRDWSMR